MSVAKRAETRPCPVCEENIPVRLLEKHAVLELQRVEDIMRGVGPSVVMYEPEAGYGLRYYVCPSCVHVVS